MEGGRPLAASGANRPSLGSLAVRHGDTVGAGQPHELRLSAEVRLRRGHAKQPGRHHHGLVRARVRPGPQVTGHEGDLVLVHLHRGERPALRVVGEPHHWVVHQPPGPEARGGPGVAGHALPHVGVHRLQTPGQRVHNDDVVPQIVGGRHLDGHLDHLAGLEAHVGGVGHAAPVGAAEDHDGLLNEEPEVHGTRKRAVRDELQRNGDRGLPGPDRLELEDTGLRPCEGFPAAVVIRRGPGCGIEPLLHEHTARPRFADGKRQVGLGRATRGVVLRQGHHAVHRDLRCKAVVRAQAMALLPFRHVVG
mmetsp:Transcript_44998/g.75667  ORF Transcript_44998/g.75667 Transcript_44998/m.75667 type:complete len:306 (+) Transcript_44998:1657-2574(+)